MGGKFDRHVNKCKRCTCIEQWFGKSIGSDNPQATSRGFTHSPEHTPKTDHAWRRIYPTPRQPKAPGMAAAAHVVRFEEDGRPRTVAAGVAGALLAGNLHLEPLSLVLQLHLRAHMVVNEYRGLRSHLSEALNTAFAAVWPWPSATSNPEQGPPLTTGLRAYGT